MARKVFNGLDLQDQRIQKVGSPVLPTDAANRSYVDAKVKGQVWKDAVRVTSTTNVDVSSPGSIIDGITLAAGDPVLLKNQTNAAENGIYVWSSPSTPLTRRDDANSADTLVPRTTVVVNEGDVNADSNWTLTTDAPITIDVTELTFVESGGGAPYTAGDGLGLTGTEFSVKAHTGILVSEDGVAIDTTVVARKYSTTVGDGTTTSLQVTHNLGTRDVTVSVHDAASYDEVYPDVVKTDPNYITLKYAVAPASGAHVVTVIG